jgi:hypothetical protein
MASWSLGEIRRNKHGKTPKTPKSPSITIVLSVLGVLSGGVCSIRLLITAIYSFWAQASLIRNWHQQYYPRLNFLRIDNPIQIDYFDRNRAMLSSRVSAGEMKTMTDSWPTD